jgi:hypothetical protein
MGEENGDAHHDNEEIAPLLANAGKQGEQSAASVALTENGITEQVESNGNSTTVEGRNNGPAAAAPNNNDDIQAADSTTKKKYHRIKWFAGILFLDIVQSILFLIPTWSWIKSYGGERLGHYTIASSLLDLGLIAIVRLVSCVLALLISYFHPVVPRDDDFPQLDLRHPNGDLKSRSELEQEALEEDFLPWFYRYLYRNAFVGEWIAVFAQVMCIVKSLFRMHLEIGTYKDEVPYHPIFWVAILLCAVFSFLEAMLLDEACSLTARYSKEKCVQQPGSTMLRTLSSGLLTTPLLSDQDAGIDTPSNDIEENGNVNNSSPTTDDTEARGTSDITGDCHFKATWSDLLMMCYPDIHLIAAAFVFLLLAAVAQVYIPRFLGNILDALAAVFSDQTSDKNRDLPMWQVPGFLHNVRYLVVASILAGVFAGARGSIFVSTSHFSQFCYTMCFLTTLTVAFNISRRLLDHVSMCDYG